MKNSHVRRYIAVLVVAAIAASCGGGGESSDTTERTRNASLWSATTEPTRKVVYGTQDGLVQSVEVPGVSGKVEPTTITTVPLSALGNTVSSVAVDTSRSEIIFGGNTPSSGVFLSKVNTDGTSKTDIYTSSTGFAYGAGYDSSSRTAVFTYFDSGSIKYVLHSVDDVSSPILSSKIPFYAIANYDGSRTLMTTGSNLREVTITDPTSTLSSSANLSSTPYDMWGFIKDPLSEKLYAARQGSGQILSTELDATVGFSKIGNAVNPAALAAFSDGAIVAGTGATLNAAAPFIGDLAIIDPTGATANIELEGVGSGASTSGVQSVWAVESPISTSPPSVSSASSGSLTCSDATWLQDLPLSRLSRAPIASVRSYAWFLEGKMIPDAISETFAPTDSGRYSCAVIAANFAGTGFSAQSATVDFEVPASTTTTTTAVSTSTTTTTGGGSEPVTTSPSSGGAEAVPGASPVVTVPEVATGTPIVVVTPTLRSAKWTFKGRTVKITFKKWSGASKYRFYVRGATRKNIVCKTAKTTVTCTTTSLKKGLNSFSAKALSSSGVTLALSTKTRLTK